MGGVFTKLIQKNTTIPTKHSQVFSTAGDNQPAVTIKVGQGERELAQYNKLLGEFNLEGIAPARRGAPQIEVTLDIDANGILNVSAKDKNTGKENKITIKANSGLTEEEIEKMIQEAEANKDADIKARAIVDAKNRADEQIHGINKNLKEHGDKLDEDQKEKLQAALKNLEEAKTTEDSDKIMEAISALAEPAKPLFDAMQQAEMAKQAEVQPGETNSEKTVEGDVVDAEFTEVKKDAK
jgi:molecular chaperone DnaK